MQANPMLIWIIGYLFLFVFRPFEVWPILGVLHLERVYMLGLMGAVALWPRRRWLRHSVNKAMLAFFSVMIVSSFWAVNSGEAFSAVADYGKLLIFYAIIITVLQEERDVEVFVTAYLLIMLMYVGKSAWEFFINDHHWWRMGVRRMMGVDITYSDPNYFAASIAYSLPFWWAKVQLGDQRKWLRLLLFAYAPLAAVAVVFTASRSGAATIIVFAFLVWLGLSRKLACLLLALALLAVGWVNLPESYQIRLMSTFKKGIAEQSGQLGADASASGRIQGLVTGYRTFLEHPVLGIGPGNFKYAWKGTSVENPGMSAHNLYGQLMGELGGTGVLAFFAAMGLVAVTHNRVRRSATRLLSAAGMRPSDQDARSLRVLRMTTIASLQALALLLFNGNFGHNLYRYNYLWIAALCVVSASLIERHDALGQAKVEQFPVARGEP